MIIYCVIRKTWVAFDGYLVEHLEGCFQKEEDAVSWKNEQRKQSLGRREAGKSYLQVKKVEVL